MRRLSLAAVLLAAALALGGCTSDDDDESRPSPRPTTPVGSPPSPASNEAKRIMELTLSDLESSPIWEFATDEFGDPLDSIEPRPDLKVADPNKGLYAVHTEFTLADGTTYFGYSTPVLNFNLVDARPTIVTPRGQVDFWYAIGRPSRASLEPSYAALGKSSQETFPLRFRMLVRTKGAPIRGLIRGFFYLEALDSPALSYIK